VHEVLRGFGVASADQVGNDQLRIHIKRGPGPHVASTFRRGFGLRQIGALAIIEAPNLIALDPASLHAANRFVVVLHASLPSQFQVAQDRHLGSAGKPGRGIHTRAFHQLVEDLAALLEGQFIHALMM